MSKVYEIEIEEILQKVVKIEADSLEDAMDIAREKYSKEEYVLDYQDYKDTEFREYKDEVLKEKKQKIEKVGNAYGKIYSTTDFR